MGRAGCCRLGTWSPPGMGRSEPAEPGSEHRAALRATACSLDRPSSADSPPRVPQIHHRHPSQLAEQQFTTSLCLHRDTGQAVWVVVYPTVPPIMHRLNSPGCLISSTHLFSKLGSFDFHKRSSHCLQITALVVKGDTARPWNKPDRKC